MTTWIASRSPLNVPPARAAALVEVLTRDEPPGLMPLWRRLAQRDTASPKLWMDAYLAAFAIASGVGLTTLDRDFKQFKVRGLALDLLAV